MNTCHVRAPRSPKRVYFKDPFIFHALRAWVLGFQDPYHAQEDFLRDPVNLGYFVESLVASHLRRTVGENTYYWRNGGEIDFIVFKEGIRKAMLEVKYQKIISSENFKILNKWGKGMVLSQDRLGQEKQNAFIPLSYFLALLK